MALLVLNLSPCAPLLAKKVQLIMSRGTLVLSCRSFSGVTAEELDKKT